MSMFLLVKLNSLSQSGMNTHDIIGWKAKPTKLKKEQRVEATIMD